jgi:Ku70/Ku80-like protein
MRHNGSVLCRGRVGEVFCAFHLSPIYLSPATSRTKPIRLHQVWRPTPVEEPEDVPPELGREQHPVERPVFQRDGAGEEADQTETAATHITLRPHDPTTGEEIEKAEVVKGYEYSRGQFVTFTAEELKALDVESSKIIDLEKFVPSSDIDPVYFDTSYYLYPDGPIAVEALRVIGAAMADAGVVGLGRLTLSRRERMVMAEPVASEWRCSHCALQPKFERHSSAALRATSMPRWSRLPPQSSDNGPGNSTRAHTETAIRRRCSS